MGSHPCLPRPSVCGSLEPTVRSRRSSSSTWILPSRGSVCPFSHPCFQWITLFARQDRYSLLFSFLSLSPPCVPTAGQRNILPFFCLLASISLRIPWALPDAPVHPNRRIDHPAEHCADHGILPDVLGLRPPGVLPHLDSAPRCPENVLDQSRSPRRTSI